MARRAASNSDNLIDKWVRILNFHTGLCWCTPHLTDIAVRTIRILSVEFSPSCGATVFITDSTDITGGFSGDGRVDYILRGSDWKRSLR